MDPDVTNNNKECALNVFIDPDCLRYTLTSIQYIKEYGSVSGDSVPNGFGLKKNTRNDVLYVCLFLDCIFSSFVCFSVQLFPYFSITPIDSPVFLIRLTSLKGSSFLSVQDKLYFLLPVFLP